MYCGNNTFYKIHETYFIQSFYICMENIFIESVSYLHEKIINDMIHLYTTDGNSEIAVKWNGPRGV